MFGTKYQCVQRIGHNKLHPRGYIGSITVGDPDLVQLNYWDNDVHCFDLVAAQHVFLACGCQIRVFDRMQISRLEALAQQMGQQQRSMPVT